MFPAKRSIPRLSTSAALVTAFVLAWCGSVAAAGGVNTGYFGGIAIMGYDSVSYFTEARAVKGSPDFSHEFLGETWHFASAENRDTFAAEPVSYAPQFGGYCAGEVHDTGIGIGVTINIDPKANDCVIGVVAQRQAIAFGDDRLHGFDMIDFRNLFQ